MSEQRLNDVESKIAFLEHHVEELNQVIIGQQAQIDRLSRELKALREWWAENRDGGGTVSDPPPPHW